jgi:hypothetical protein
MKLNARTAQQLGAAGRRSGVVTRSSIPRDTNGTFVTSATGLTAIPPFATAAPMTAQIPCSWERLE